MRESTVPHIIRPALVRRHLTHAALGRSAACMTSSYLRVPGTFSSPDQGGRITFFGRQDERSVDMEIGQSVRVDYRFERNSLVFFSRVTEYADQGTWILDRPRSVQRLSRRTEPRIAMSDDAGVRIALITNHGFQSYTVVDLSNGGAAVQYDARDVGLWIGRRVTVWLELSRQQPIPVTAEVRHVSRRGCPPGFKLAGLRFVGTPMDARRAIDVCLSGSDPLSQDA